MKMNHTIRKALLALLPLVIMTTISIVALAIDWDNPQGKSADELINGTPEYFKTIDPSLGATPQESRKIHANNTGKDLFKPMHDSLSSGNTPQEAREQGTTSSDSIPASTAASTDTISSKQSSNTSKESTIQTNSRSESSDSSSGESRDISGSWTLELQGETTKEMALTIFQTGTDVFGTGRSVNGNETLLATASGSLRGDSLNLDLVTMGSIQLYKIDLRLDGDFASGNYTVVSVSGELTEGSVNGTRAVPGD